VAWLLRTLEPADAKVLREWLPMDVSAAWIARQIKEETGLNADANAIQRHRRSGCKC
jgi:Ni,Fe-hydrogenase III component G